MLDPLRSVGARLGLVAPRESAAMRAARLRAELASVELTLQQEREAQAAAPSPPNRASSFVRRFGTAAAVDSCAAEDTDDAGDDDDDGADDNQGGDGNPSYAETVFCDGDRAGLLTRLNTRPDLVAVREQSGWAERALFAAWGGGSGGEGGGVDDDDDGFLPETSAERRRRDEDFDDPAFDALVAEDEVGGGWRGRKHLPFM